MSAERPDTIQEWGNYVSGLAGETLRAMTATVNSMAFIETMKNEGHDTDHCQEILMLFVRQCCATDAGLPKTGMWDLTRLAAGDEMCTLGPQMSPMEAVDLEKSHIQPPDDIDRFLLEADYEID